jgi:hypothetical protein
MGAMAMAELDQAMLLTDLPDHGLRAGDVGVVVGVYGDGEAYEIEFLTADGDTVAVETLPAAQVTPLAGRRILHARPFATA